MSGKGLNGIVGYLGDYEQPEPPQRFIEPPEPNRAELKVPTAPDREADTEVKSPARTTRTTTADDNRKPGSPPTPMGRPPGSRTGDRELKAKATVWVNAELMHWYRERVWQERCQLGELIEKALRDYRQRIQPDNFP